MAEQDGSAGPWRVSVDSGACIGSGVCVGGSPDYFRFVDDKSQPVNEFVAADEAVIDAAEGCPVEAIMVTEVATGRVLAPEE